MTNPQGESPTDSRSVLAEWLAAWLDPTVPRDALRSMTDVNRRGLEAAARIVDRMTDLVDGTRAGGARVEEPARTGGAVTLGRPSDGHLGRLRADATKALELWSDAMVELIDAAIDAFADTASDRHTTVHEELVVGPVRAGEGARAPIHVVAATGQGLLTFAIGTFESADGHALSRESVVVTPAVLAEGEHEPVLFAVEVPKDVPPGRYHGFVFARGVDDTALAATIHVTASRTDEDPA